MPPLRGSDGVAPPDLAVPALPLQARLLRGREPGLHDRCARKASSSRRFLLWSSVGGITWSIYTCALAYWIGTALADYPIASIAISGVVTTVIFGAAYLVYRRFRSVSDNADDMTSSRDGATAS